MARCGSESSVLLTRKIATGKDLAEHRFDVGGGKPDRPGAVFLGANIWITAAANSFVLM